MPRTDQRNLPPKAVEAMSRTLYTATGPLVTGSVVLCIAATLVARRTDGAFPTLCALALLAVGILRVALVRAYDRAPHARTGGERMRGWRRAYAAGALASTGLIGILAGVGVAAYDDPVAHMILVATAVGYGSGVAGRNAACLEVSLPQLWAALLPTAIGLVAHGGAEYVVLGLVVVAFAVGMTQIGLSLNATIVAAYLSSQEREALADRFDAALASMAHGFCLLDADGRLVAGSDSFGAILGIPVPPQGTDVAGIAAACAAAGATVPGGDGLGAVIASLARSRRGGHRDVALAGGRTVSLTASPKADGGCVLVLEDVTERVASTRDLARLARLDPLTGLLNRAAAADALAEHIAHGTPVAIHLIDLDKFKAVNDGYGHAAGDGLLRAVAGRIRSRLTTGAVAARVGGDEFMVVQPVGAADPGRLAAALAAALAAPYEIDGREIASSASVGFAVSPRDADGADALMRNADTALYRVKSAGRCGWRGFDPIMDAQDRETRQMEADLREAVSDGAFHLVYQPQLSLATGATVAYEALLRWEHPTRGSVPPSDFIPLAEQTGMIHAIGETVLRKACEAAASWDDAVGVAVNVSPVQLRNDLPATVARVLAETGLPPRRLELEVTESVFLESRDEVLAAFGRLGAMGVTISLDDFGTGYSSLGYLRAFPFRKVKVDRAFVAGIEAPGEGRAVVRAVIGLGADLGMEVVAEGVETPAQLAALRDLGCGTVQGYLVGRPLTPEAAGRRGAGGGWPEGIAA